MINGAHVVLYSKDAEMDRAFFKDILQFPFVDVHNGWLIFKLSPSEAAVHPSEGNDKHELFLMTDDLDAEIAALKDLPTAARAAVMRTGLIFAVLFAAVAVPANAGTCDLKDLGWMAGNWRNTETPDRAQERWVAAPDGVLMGSAFEFPAGKAGYAEAMTLRTEGSAVVMVLRHFDGGLRRAWEPQDDPMIFAAATCEANRVVFDGQGAHAGEHLTYERAGRSLHIVGDFLHKGVASHVEWRMVRAGD